MVRVISQRGAGWRRSTRKKFTARAILLLAIPVNLALTTISGVQAQSNFLINARSIAAGDAHTCALLSSGAVVCWGSNSSGQLGNNSTATSRVFPVGVVGLSSGVTQITSGANHTCALLGSGSVRCWGQNQAGQLGANSTTAQRAPTDVSGLSGGVTQISAGRAHTCALSSSGAVKCWGSNTYGAVGDGTTTNRLVPVAVTGLASGVVQISAGGDHTCARLQDGRARCWGWNYDGQLVTANPAGPPIPPLVASQGRLIAQIDAKLRYTCLRTSTGGLRCGGYNGDGGLGSGTNVRSSLPVTVGSFENSGVSQIATGGAASHSCAILTLGSVQCWGSNATGQIGDGTTTNRNSPTQVQGLTNGVREVSTGGGHSCAVLNSGDVRCWGKNDLGQLGDGSVVNRTAPVSVISSGNPAARCSGPIDQSKVSYSQSSVDSSSQRATNAGMNNGSFLETAETSTGNSRTEWIQMDLGCAYPLTSITIGSDFNNLLRGRTGKLYSENKPVQYSIDGGPWFDLFNTGSFSQGIQTYPTNQLARYIRISSFGAVTVTEFSASSGSGGACNPGSYRAAGASTCSQCPVGYRCPGDGNSYACAPGSFSPFTGAIACSSCPAGSYGSTAGLTSATCSGLCPAGTYGATAGLTTAACSGRCAAGSFCPGGSTSASEIQCQPGTYSSAGARGPTDCLACPRGSIPNPQQSACVPDVSPTEPGVSTFTTAGGVGNAMFTLSSRPGDSVWQSFTARSDGTLTKIEMTFVGPINGSGTLKVFSGTGISGNPIFTGSQPVACPTGRYCNVPFTVSAQVSAGSIYTVQFLPGSGSYGLWVENPGSYPAGQFALATPQGSSMLSYDLPMKVSIAAGSQQCSGTIDSRTIVYSQSSVHPLSRPATTAAMTNVSFLETNQTATSGSAGPNWIKMDLGCVYPIGSVTIGSDFRNTLVGGWGKRFTENKIVESSVDNLTWSQMFNTGGFSQGVQRYVATGNARYIRIRSLQGAVAVTEFYATSRSGGASQMRASDESSRVQKISNPGSAVSEAGGSESQDANGDAKVNRNHTSHASLVTSPKQEARTGPLSVKLEGIYDNFDGSYTAYLSYKNSSPSTIEIPIGDSGSEKNILLPSQEGRGQPTSFKKGSHTGAIRITFKGERVTWALKTRNDPAVQIQFSTQSPRLSPVLPVVDCITTSASGGVQAIMGYNNPNDFEIRIPVGTENAFAPGEPDRTQPDIFFYGLNRGAFSVNASPPVAWRLSGTTANISPSGPSCDCPVSDNSRSKKQILSATTALGLLVFESATTLEETAKVKPLKLSASDSKLLGDDIKRAKNRATRGMISLKAHLNAIPAESRSCPTVAVTCQRIDDGSSVLAIRRQLKSLGESLEKLAAWGSNGASTQTDANAQTRMKGAALAHEALEALGTIPRFRVKCGREAR